MPERVVMLIDLDYFYAQCEELRNPSLKEKPVVVCVFSGRTEDSGAVSTANYVARKFGVKSGMPIYQAKKKLENVDAAFLPLDDELYQETSNKVMKLLTEYADILEQVGIDEAYLDVTRRTAGSYKIARDLGNEIKDNMRKRLGLTCSIGVGPNKLIAKVAADENKPDGLTIVEPDQVRNFLKPLPVSRLLGVGSKTVEKMRSIGIHTISDLSEYDVQKLVTISGRNLGTYFHNASLGIDNEPVKERGEPESLSRIATLRENTHDLGLIIEKADELCNDLYANIDEQKAIFKSISIIAISKDLGLYSRSRTFENPTNSLEVMKKTVAELFEKFLSENASELRRVGVKLSGLSAMEKSQSKITSYFHAKENSLS